MADHFLEIAAFAIIISGPLPLAFFVAGRRSARGCGGADIIAASLATWFLTQLVLLHFLGLISQLDRAPLLITEGCLLALGGLAFWKRGRPEAFFTSIHSLRPGPYAGLLSGLTIIGLIEAATHMARGYDTYSYHLPEVARWLVHGDFRLFSAMTETNLGYYPFLWDALLVLPILSFREDFLVTFPSVLAWLFFVFILLAMMRDLGADHRRRRLIAALVAAMPVVFGTTLMAYVDLGQFACFFACLYYGTRYLQRRHGDNLILAFGCAGVVMGAKVSGVGYLLLAAVYLMTWRWEKGPFAVRGRPRRAALAGGIGLFLFLGSFWYIRNLIYAGHPLGGISGNAFKTSLLGAGDFWSLRNMPGYIESMMYSLGPAGGLVLLIGVLSIRRLLQTRTPSLLVLTIGSLVLYTVTPFSATSWVGGFHVPWFTGNVRFAIPFLASMALVGSLGEVKKRSAGLALDAFVFASVFLSVGVALVYGVFGYSDVDKALAYVTPAWIVLGASIWMGTAASRLEVSIGQKVVGALGLAVCLVAASFGARALHDSARTRFHGGIQLYLEKTIGPDEPFIVADADLPYLYYGRHFDLDARSQLFPGRYNFGMRPNVGPVGDLATHMREQNIRFLVLGPSRDADPDLLLDLEREIEKGTFQRLWGENPELEPIMLLLNTDNHRQRPE